MREVGNGWCRAAVLKVDVQVPGAWSTCRLSPAGLGGAPDPSASSLQTFTSEPSLRPRLPPQAPLPPAANPWPAQHGNRRLRPPLGAVTCHAWCWGSGRGSLQSWLTDTHTCILLLYMYMSPELAHIYYLYMHFVNFSINIFYIHLNKTASDGDLGWGFRAVSGQARGQG